MKEKLNGNEKIRKILKSPVMLIVIFSIITVVLSLGTSYAANVYLYDSKDVSYDNTRSGIIATDVQGAVDELYSAANDYSSINTRVNGVEDTIGDSTLTTTDQTLIGGINELNDQIKNINSINLITGSEKAIAVKTSNIVNLYISRQDNWVTKLELESITLPLFMRPKSKTYMYGMYYDGSSWNPTMLAVKSDGTLTIENPAPSTYIFVAGSGSYVPGT